MDNITAKVSCFARAYHYLNNTVHVFADSAAKDLLGADYDQIAAHMSQGGSFFLPDFDGSKEEGLRLIVDRQLSPSVLARSAYCEKMLENEKKFGCRQYVIFASGYDTYAIRNRDSSMKVYELDLEEMAADKKKKIEEAGLHSDAVYVPCNLADISWKDRLIENGFDCQQRSFGSLLGISYYLDREDFEKLLKTISGIMSEGSSICFDYPAKEDSHETQVNQALARGAGEPMKAQYTYGEMEKMLEECGLLIYEHLDHKEMGEQYFADYNAHNPSHNMEATKGVCYVLAVKK